MLSKKIKIITITFAASLAFTQTTTAREFAEIYTDCGLGAMIAPRTPAVAAVTNVTFDLGTTAILSNISTPDTCMGGQVRIAAFINNAYESLETDLARGRGEYLDALTVLAGVKGHKKTSFIQTLRGNFAASVAEPDYTRQTRFQKAENLYNLLRRQTESNS